jgi:hypothetical protein
MHDGIHSYSHVKRLTEKIVADPGGHPNCPTYGHPNCSTLATVI